MHFLRSVPKTFLLILLMGVAFPVTPSAMAETVLSAQEARARQENGALTLVDIRRMSEWAESGIPEGAVAISMHDPAGVQAFLANILDSVDGDRQAPIGLICASGVRSTWASQFLEGQGFTNVFNIKEGMLGRGPSLGWIKQGLPVSAYSN